MKTRPALLLPRMRLPSMLFPPMHFPAMAVCLVLACPASAQWASWRGPQATGVSLETRLPESIEKSILWRYPIGGGRSSPVIHDGHVYISSRGGEGVTQREEVICFDAATGKVVWVDRINVFHTTIPGPRVGWANPTVDPETGNVYFHGVEGLLKCYDRKGAVIWSRSLTEEYGSISGYGGRTNTPIIDEDRMVLSFLNASWGDQGRGAHRFVAFDKLTGEVLWWSSPGGAPLDTTYSTPVVAVIGGVRQLVVGCADGWVYGLEARTGEKIWGFHLSKRGINVSPVVQGNLVYISHSEENVDSTALGRVVCIDATGKGDVTKTHEKWRADEITAGYASPAIAGDRLYVCDNSANLFAFDANTGHELWEYNLGTESKASPVLADGKIYVGEVNGPFHILRPGASACESIDMVRFRAPDGRKNEIFGSCAVGGGRVFVSTRDELICLGSRDWKGKAPAPPPQPPEPAVSRDDAPATLIVTPADVELEPGRAVSFRPRLYNDRGQYLRDADPRDVTWSLAGLAGSLGEDGKLALPIPLATGFQAGLVNAKLGDLEASVRVRVSPPPPMRIDFNDVAAGQLPRGWIGMSPIKFETVDLDGERVLNKHGTSQRFARALAFFGPPDLSDYTIEADVRGVFRRRTLPDMGLINQRYRLALIGVDQVLRVLTWVPEKRLEKNVPFEWKQDVWYRMKFRVEPKGDAALIRARVWPRDEKEPEAWTLEIEDPFPHDRGSPGIYAYTAGTTARSRGTDVYFDNIIVTRNDAVR